MTLKKVNPDLQKERATCTFNVEELTNILDTGVEYTTERRALEDLVFSVKELKDDIPEEFMSHKQKYENAIRKAVLLHKVLNSGNSIENFYERKDKSGFRRTIGSAIFKDGSPFMLHSAMFIPTLLGQADEEQKKVWYTRAKNMEIIGTYAQTELGHGTFIRGLETEATYDEQTEEFILHSPTLTSYKWWPGGLGQTSNYCIVMAQLKIKGKSYGMQPFIVQIRDEENHMPMPGVKVGEIGAKLGFNTVNNGYLGFDNVRIPRRNMLMKNSQVLKDGTFKSAPNSKLAYGTMVMVRVTIVNTTAGCLSRAVTIAMRYSAVRHQSQLKANEPEPQILDYVTQQHKLFIGIATSYAYTFSSYWLWDLYSKYIQEMGDGNYERLPELHALACVMKVISSSDCTALIEKCRLSCGGHGFMLSSNLPQIYGLSTATCTYEGENTVLLLQTARSLVKAWNDASKGGKLRPTMAYLADPSPAAEWDTSLDGIIKAFQKVSVGKLSSSVSSLTQYAASGMSPEEAWNKASVQLIAAAEAFGRAVVLSVFKSEVEKYVETASQGVRSVLFDLVELYFTHMVLDKMGDLLLYTKLTGKDVHLLQRKYEDLLEKIRPNAIGLVDAFDYRDEVLNSALGAYDGMAYERLMAEAAKSPLNAEPVNGTYHKYLKPLMKGKL
ncbi:probable peroxisomal acyl-coenzyme A oxidase 1 [Zerene cesonia]|uniref:probable peroxisomal acyl-coenzyme A oxidase 1 n=1 Tax=Zerene cesonia TaxID=33412 RepID=UPI0018E5A6A1|nr:probable peroxisomal acyl-coenzyme A oxidase 1 [Zerene cesonia]